MPGHQISQLALQISHRPQVVGRCERRRPQLDQNVLCACRPQQSSEVQPGLRVLGDQRELLGEEVGKFAVGRRYGRLQMVRVDDLDDPAGLRDAQEFCGGSWRLGWVEILKDPLGADHIELGPVERHLADVGLPKVDFDAGACGRCPGAIE